VGYAANNVCYDTALSAAEALCRTAYPFTESIGDAALPVTLLTSCSSADQSGLTGSRVRLNLSRSAADSAPTALSLQMDMPQCTGIGDGGSAMDFTFWTSVVIVMALGYIGGRLR